MANLDYGRPLRKVWGILARFCFRPDANTLRDLARDGAEGLRKEARPMPKIIWEPAALDHLRAAPADEAHASYRRGSAEGGGCIQPDPVQPRSRRTAEFYRDAQPGVVPPEYSGPPAASPLPADSVSSGLVPADSANGTLVRRSNSVGDSPGSPRHVRQALATRGLLRQTDDVTCGPASVIVARMLTDEPYARMILTGHDDRTGRPDPAGTDAEGVRARFAEQSGLVHARSNRMFAAGPSPQSRGRLARSTHHLRLPWPRALGTAPWAVRDELSRFRRRRYRVALVDSDSPASRRSAYAALANAAAAGMPSALFTGSNALPRHVVLVLGTDASATELQVFDPGRGVVVGLALAEFLSDLGAVSWTRPWTVVLPSG